MVPSEAPAFRGSCTSSSPQFKGTTYEIHALHDADLTDSRAPRHRTSRFRPPGSSHVEVSDLRVSALDATMSQKSQQSIVSTHYNPDLQGIRTPRFSQAKVLHYTATAGTPECGDLEDRGPSSAGSWRSGLQCVGTLKCGDLGAWRRCCMGSVDCRDPGGWDVRVRVP